MTNPLFAALAQARLRAAPLFARWCEREGATFCPAAPATIAHFVRDHAGLGIDRLWSALKDIAKLHASMGLADPTLGEPVTAAVNDVARIAPPRSWPAADKERFKALPYDLQVFISSHEARRDKVLRRAQNEAAVARQRLTALQRMHSHGESDQRHENSTQHTDA